MRRASLTSNDVEIIFADCEFLRAKNGRKVLAKTISPHLVVAASLAPGVRLAKAVNGACGAAEALQRNQDHRHRH